MHREHTAAAKTGVARELCKTNMGWAHSFNKVHMSSVKGDHPPLPDQGSVKPAVERCIGKICAGLLREGTCSPGTEPDAVVGWDGVSKLGNE